MVDTGVFRSPFRLTLFSPACFPQPCFPQPCFSPNMCASSAVPSVYFPQSTSLNLIACISLSPLPQHLTTSESLRSIELTRTYAYYLSSHPCYVMGPKSIDSCSVPVPPMQMRQIDNGSCRHVSRNKRLTSGIADVFENFFEND